MEKSKKTLNEHARKLHYKAAEIERAVIILVENEEGDGFTTYVGGSVDKLSNMIVRSADNSRKFDQVMKHSMLAISINKINDLLKKNNPFEKKEKPVFNGTPSNAE